MIEVEVKEFSVMRKRTKGYQCCARKTSDSNESYDEETLVTKLFPRTFDG